MVPILSPSEAAAIRYTGGASAEDIPEAAPFLSRTPGHANSDIPELLIPGSHTHEILAEIGISDEETQTLIHEGALGGEAQEQSRL